MAAGSATVRSVSSQLARQAVTPIGRLPMSVGRWNVVVVAGLTTIAVAVAPHPGVGGGPQFALLLMAFGPIVLLRRWPLPILFVTVLALALVINAGGSPLTMSVLVAQAAYLTGSRLDRRTAMIAGGGAAVAIGAAVAVAALTRPQLPVATLAVVALLPPVAAWFVGDAAATRRRYQAGLAEQQRRERDARAERDSRRVREERIRIAQELHDVVAHTLTVITVQAGVGRRLMSQRPDEAAQALQSIEQIGRTAQEELRVVLELLREDEGARLDLLPAPRLADLAELANTVRASGIPVEISSSGNDSRLSPALELSLYRVVQEALTNVVRHAPGAAARVTVAIADTNVRLEIVDTGPRDGAPPAAAGDGSPAPAPAGHLPSGHGILGMRERVAAFGGRLSAAARPQGGYAVVAEVPIGE